MIAFGCVCDSGGYVFSTNFFFCFSIWLTNFFSTSVAIFHSQTLKMFSAIEFKPRTLGPSCTSYRHLFISTAESNITNGGGYKVSTHVLKKMSPGTLEATLLNIIFSSKGKMKKKKKKIIIHRIALDEHLRSLLDQIGLHPREQPFHCGLQKYQCLTLQRKAITTKVQTRP